MAIKVLALGHTNKEIRAVNLCTTEEWDDALKDFPKAIRGEAANLAAHGWDVVVFDDLLFIGGAARGYDYSKDGTKTTTTMERRDILYPRQETYIGSTRRIWDDEKELGTGEEILRKNEINLSSFPEAKTFRIMYRALELTYGELEHYRKWENAEGKIDYAKKFERMVRILQNRWNDLKSIADE